MKRILLMIAMVVAMGICNARQVTVTYLNIIAKQEPYYLNDTMIVNIFWGNAVTAPEDSILMYLVDIKIDLWKKKYFQIKDTKIYNNDTYMLKIPLDSFFTTQKTRYLSLAFENTHDLSFTFDKSKTRPTAIDMASLTPDEEGDITIFNTNGVQISAYRGYKLPEDLVAGVYLYTYEGRNRRLRGKVVSSK